VSYAFKLSCLSLAAFFLVHLAAGMAAGWATPRAIRMAGRMQARAAARFLLTVRFAPLALAGFVVAVLCVPSYVWFEPDVDAEEVGWLCLIAASLSLAIWALSFARTARAVLKSRRWLRQAEAREVRLAGENVWIAKGSAVAVAGFLRPRVLLSSPVLRVLSPEQLDVALRHERSHSASRDNLKRLLFLLTPDPLPFFRGTFLGLECAWKKFAEWAADDCATGGDQERALLLADALVQVARIDSVLRTPVLVTSLVDGDLTARVERLLRPAPEGAPDRWTPAACSVGALAVAVVILQPGALAAVYAMLERLIR